jgi:hypothetical protein
MFGPSPPPRASTNVETAVVVGTSSLVIYLMTRPAFDTFFIGEDFNSISLFVGADRHFFKAIFTPVYAFFRPTAFAASIVAQEVLRPDPALHHWLNFALLVLSMSLLYRIRSIPFAQFSLADIDPSKTLTYRMDFDRGSFINPTDLSHQRACR